jgi:hypothetical protein
VQLSAPEPSIEPSENRPGDDVRTIFDAWVAATERDAAKTKLTADRRRLTEKALGSHGLADCLAAVRHIGADAWARGHNDRQTRFDDLKHALGSSERIERWRDQQPREQANGGKPVNEWDHALAAAVSRDVDKARRARRGAALQSLAADGAADPDKESHHVRLA